MSSRESDHKKRRRRRPVKIKVVKAAERRAISRRRSAWFTGKDALNGTEDLFGIGLSGGGIRSASFSLGALQALDALGLIKRADYLSTVSGGGYIGTGMVASMTRHARELQKEAPDTEPAYFFPYGVPQRERPASGQRPANKFQDNAFVGHIRDHGKFLIPHGISDVILSVGVLARGLAVNFFLILMLIVPLAAITVATNPTEAHLERSVIVDILAWWCGKQPILPFPPQFVLSWFWGLVFLVYLIGWGIWRSCLERDAVMRNGLDAVPHRGTLWAQFIGMQLVLAFALEVQGPILHSLFETLRQDEAAKEVLPSLYVAAASFVGATVAIRSKLVGLIEKALANPGIGSFVKAAISRVLLLAAGLIVPLLIYTAYLGLSLLGIAAVPAGDLSQVLARLLSFLCGIFSVSGFRPIYTPPETSPYILSSGWIDGQMILLTLLVALLVVMARHAIILFFTLKGWQMLMLFGRRVKKLGLTSLGLILAICTLLAFLCLAAYATRHGVSAGSSGRVESGPANEFVVLWIYVVASILVILGAFLFSPNANSLHSLYRDRLSVAFRLGQTRNVKTAPMQLTELTHYAPYLLVNATLNARVDAKTQNRNRGTPIPKGERKTMDDSTSDSEADASHAQLRPDPVKRGRNADFFHFSRDYTGSDSTKYARTSSIQTIDVNLSLAAAAAISGAAFTSNMGRANINALSPTLALLNIRLGYWLDNPRYCNREIRELPAYLPWHDFFRAYLFAEAFGLLRTDSSKVYVTDGGHVDNLGLYQLLRRRCRVIVIVDAEADPAMHFGALVDVERFARIDLGCRINIDFTGMQRAAAGRKNVMADKIVKGTQVDDADPVHADHFAIGEIDYGDGKEKGTLIYIKALVTGDEPDYVLDYERRYPSFPHESTSDQFFSEEQMEAYRALGFHAVERMLSTPMEPRWASAPSRETKAAVIRAFKAQEKVRTAKITLGIHKETLDD